MLQRESLVYTFTIESRAVHFFDVVLSNYVRGPGKYMGLERAYLDGCAVIVRINCAKREELLAALDFLANHNGGVRDEGMGGVAVPAEEQPYPPRGPRVLFARAVAAG